MQAHNEEQRPNIRQNGKKASAVIVAAGSGSRLGSSTPKQFLQLGNKTVLEWSLETFLSHGDFSGISLVLPENWTNYLSNARLASLAAQYPEITLVTALGGETRGDSVRNGLEALKSNISELVFIHDAARPGLSHGVLDLLIDALQDTEGAAPALPVVDALKYQSDTEITDVDRHGLHRIQTPQAFHTSAYERALSNADQGAVDDFETARKAGLSLTLVTGSEALSKITYPEDLKRLERLLTERQLTYRTGNGFDVHGFEPGDHVWLAGIRIDHDAKLKGHSDADVGWHAITDALLGAIAAGDIGDHFPPSDPQWKGAPSDVFLRHAAQLVRDKGGNVEHVDLTLICEAPKVGPHRSAMRSRTAEVLGIAEENVSIKATTTEKLGFTGRKEGIAAQATATVSLPAAL